MNIHQSAVIHDVDTYLIFSQDLCLSQGSSVLGMNQSGALEDITIYRNASSHVAEALGHGLNEVGDCKMRNEGLIVKAVQTLENCTATDADHISQANPSCTWLLFLLLYLPNQIP